MSTDDALLNRPVHVAPEAWEGPRAGAIRVLVVDDHPIIRIGLTRMIGQAFRQGTIEEAGSVKEAKQSLARSKPDIITLDLMLPDAEGTEALSQLLRVSGGIPILVISLSSEETHAERAMQLGAAGYLNKERATGELVVAMKRLLSGGRYVSSDTAERLIAALSGNRSVQLPHERLSTQEYRVLQLIAAGLRSSQIAETMHLSVKTVANYRARIFEKCGWRNNVELTKYCVQHGLTSKD